jgi:hypothetical protein
MIDGAVVLLHANRCQLVNLAQILNHLIKLLTKGVVFFVKRCSISCNKAICCMQDLHTKLLINRINYLYRRSVSF